MTFQDRFKEVEKRIGETNTEEIPEPLISGREAAIRGFLQEFTFGFQDEIEARLKSFVSGTYEERLEAVRELNRIAEKQQPGKYKGGEYGAMAVTLLPLMGSGVGAVPALAKVLAKFGMKNAPKLALKTAKSQMKALKNFKPSPKMSTAQKRMAKEKLQREAAQREVKEFSKTILKEGVEQMAKGAGMGAVQGYGKAEGDTFFDDLKEAGKGAAVGGLTGTLLPFGKLALQGGKGLYTGALARLTGLTKEQTDWIKKNKDLFRGAKSIEDTQENLIQMLNKVDKAERKFLNIANKSLKPEQTIPKEFVTNPINRVIEKEKERLLMGQTPMIGEDVNKYINKLEDLKKRISEGKFGYDPDSNLVSEQNIMSLYKQLEKDAYKYVDKFSQEQNQMYAKALRQIRNEYKSVLAESNPQWNRAMEPVREIERVLGGDKTRNIKGFRELYNVEKVNDKVGYDPKFTKGGKDQLTKSLKNVYGAPFVKNGMQNEQLRRNSLDDLQDIYTKYVEAPQAKVGVGPVKKFETVGKVERPTIREKGEAAYMEAIADTQPPRTGEVMLEQRGIEGGLEVAVPDISQGAAKASASVLTLLQRSLGKRLAAEAASMKAPVLSAPIGKIGETVEKVVDRGGPLGVPRLVTKEAIDKDPQEGRREQLKHMLRRRREKVQPGEKYGFDRFEGIKQPGKTIPLSFQERFKEMQNKPEESNTDIMKEKENEEMERKKQEFLKQQQGIKKARF